MPERVHPEFQDLIETASRRSLTIEEAARAMAIMAAGEADAAAIRAFLLTPALSLEGVETATLTGLAREVRARVVPSPEIKAAMRFDTCGTGGGITTFNVSTASSFVLAAALRASSRPEIAAAVVCKHGNRAVASRSGSADVLEELGIPFDLLPADNARLIEETGWAFFFAPKYHGAFAHVAPVRKALAAEGKRTAFNLIGPVANPAGVTHQVVGVFSPSRIRVVAETLRALGARAVLVVSGQTSGGEILDEITLDGKTSAARVEGDSLVELELSSSDFGLPSARFSELAVSDRVDSARIIRGIIEGREQGSPREAVVIANVAAALSLAGLGTLRECVLIATAVLRDGAARRLLETVIERSRFFGSHASA